MDKDGLPSLRGAEGGAAIGRWIEDAFGDQDKLQKVRDNELLWTAVDVVVDVGSEDEDDIIKEWIGPNGALDGSPDFRAASSDPSSISSFSGLSIGGFAAVFITGFLLLIFTGGLFYMCFSKRSRARRKEKARRKERELQLMEPYDNNDTDQSSSSDGSADDYESGTSQEDIYKALPSQIGVNSSGGSTGNNRSLNQFAFVNGTNDYKFGHNSIPNLPITGFPADADYDRWAMLFDGVDHRLYIWKNGTNDTFYQGALNRATSSYQYGYKSIPQLTLENMPADADSSSFGMLHDGTTYRLYLKNKNNKAELIQFGFNPSVNTYVFFSRIPITSAPADIEWDGWGMLHDGAAYRLYNWKYGTNGTKLYQASFNGSSYQFGFNSTLVLDLIGTPLNSNLSNFAMLHDGAYRFYLQTK